ncbi:uncharacterized protein LOC114332184 [Diabrotica virgifera virgifera]|uniref:Uncharacterized protein LOC114332184 n=1 Tax=Diabrotica virgifera virgifera TaxID=50390 RepID=A0A6P7FSF2_DIAVI|nr:uncharacterized protein LOC114332184 [Diabrotica virgifera virgifera]
MEKIAFFIFMGFMHHAYILRPSYSKDTFECVLPKLETVLPAQTKCGQNYTPPVDVLKITHRKDVRPFGFVSDRCFLRPGLDDCFERSMDFVSDCFNSSNLQGLETWKKIDNEVTEYVCKNNSEVAYELFLISDARCYIEQISDTLDHCVPLLKLNTTIYDIQGLSQSCKNSEEFYTCFIKDLRKACSETVIEIASTLIKILESHLCPKPDVK